MIYVNRADWTRQLLSGMQRRFATMILSITAIIITCLILQARHPYFFEFEDADFDYKLTPIGKPWHPDFKYNVLLNGHCHTDNPEDDGQLTNRQVIKWHIANGFNATVITGHNSLMPAKRTRDLARAEYNAELKVLLGLEWTNCRMHMNLIGIEQEPPNWKYPTDEQIKHVIELTHAQGGVVVLNHIPWSIPRMLDYPSKEQMTQWGIDYIEVASSEYFDLQTFVYVRDEHLGMITGTDMHYPEPVHAWTTLQAEEFTEEAIMQQLRDRRTSFIYDAYGRRGTEQWRWKKFNSFISPFVLLGEVIRYNFYREDKGMWSFVDGTFCEEDHTIFYLHWGMIAITLFWVLLLFVLGEIVRLIVMHYWQQHCKHRWGRELKQQSFKYSL